MQTYAARPADRRAGRIHFKGERESRRRQILAAILELPVSVRIYSSDLRYELDAQQACLAKLVSDIAAAGASRLVIERDDSMVRHDRRTLIEAVAKAGCRDRLRYDHLRSDEDSLLWISDAVAWCWSKGGRWRRQVEPIVFEVIKVP